MSDFSPLRAAITIVLIGLVAVGSISTLNTHFAGRTRSRERKIADGFLKLRAGLPKVGKPQFWQNNFFTVMDFLITRPRNFIRANSLDNTMCSNVSGLHAKRVPAVESIMHMYQLL
jgi:hypothetical protein